MYLVYGKKEIIEDRRRIGINNQESSINQEGKNYQVWTIV